VAFVAVGPCNVNALASCDAHFHLHRFLSHIVWYRHYFNSSRLVPIPLCSCQLEPVNGFAIIPEPGLIGVAPTQPAGAKEGKMYSLEECFCPQFAIRSPALNTPNSIPRFISMLIFVAVVGLNPALTNAQSNPLDKKCPPPTRKDDVVERIHGVSIADPYRWLEDQNSPETRAWIEAQDHCATALLDAVPNRAEVAKRLTELMKVDSFDVPIARTATIFSRNVARIRIYQLSTVATVFRALTK
jgi:hypothetical protein